jgi:hypothetical protein
LQLAQPKQKIIFGIIVGIVAITAICVPTTVVLTKKLEQQQQ